MSIILIVLVSGPGLSFEAVEGSGVLALEDVGQVAVGRGRSGVSVYPELMKATVRSSMISNQYP